MGCHSSRHSDRPSRSRHMPRSNSTTDTTPTHFCTLRPPPQPPVSSVGSVRESRVPQAGFRTVVHLLLFLFCGSVVFKKEEASRALVLNPCVGETRKARIDRIPFSLPTRATCHHPRPPTRHCHPEGADTWRGGDGGLGAAAGQAGRGVANQRPVSHLGTSRVPLNAQKVTILWKGCECWHR